MKKTSMMAKTAAMAGKSHLCAFGAGTVIVSRTFPGKAVATVRPVLPPSASVNAVQLSKRSCGLFESAFMRAALAVEEIPSTGSGARFTTAMSITAGSPVSKTPAKGGSPDRSS